MYRLGRYLFLDIRILQTLTYLAGINSLNLEVCSFLLFSVSVLYTNGNPTASDCMKLDDDIKFVYFVRGCVLDYHSCLVVWSWIIFEGLTIS